MIVDKLEYEMEKMTKREDYEIARSFSKRLDEVYEDIKKDIETWLPNLTIYISPAGELTVWVKGRGEGVELPFPAGVNVGNMMVHHTKYLVWLNKEVEKIINEPDKYFWCTECGKVQPKENLHSNVFAGYYCNDCYNNKEDVRKLVARSNERGFYD